MGSTKTETVNSVSNVSTRAQALIPIATPTTCDSQPDFKISRRVSLSVPDQSIQDSFQIAADLLVQMRHTAYRYYKCDGWLSVCDDPNDRRHVYDPRDFRYASKCAAYLWGGHPLMSEIGKRIFFDEHDMDGRLGWALSDGQTAIHIAQVAKHFSDYLRYSEQDKFVTDHWDRLVRIIKWTLAEYDRNSDGLIEHGRRAKDHVWAYLVGEPENSFIWKNSESDVVVVASMEVCEWVQLMADYGEPRHLPDVDWLKSKAAQMRSAIETQAYDADAGGYYLVQRARENKWYHSGRGINEESRELDVTPYYAAFVGGNDSRGRKTAEYARRLLIDKGVFPMPLAYPTYYWTCVNYPNHGFVSSGCWEEAYYNCVRAFSKYGMLDAVYTSVKRRSDAHVRDGDCREWFTLRQGIGSGVRRYGITAAGHLSAIIEGLFGITPAGFGFAEINIWPATPASWANQPASIAVTLPDGGFVKYTYLYREDQKTVTFSIETDKQRQGHFRVPVPGLIRSMVWNGDRVRGDFSTQAEGQSELVLLDRPFTNAVLIIEME